MIILQRMQEILKRADDEAGSQTIQSSRLSRESLYRALSRSGNPEFAAILKWAALGLKLSAGPASEED